MRLSFFFFAVKSSLGYIGLIMVYILYSCIAPRNEAPIVGEFRKQKGKKKLWHQLPFEEWQTLSPYIVPATMLSLFPKIIRYITLDDELEGLVISDDLGNSNSRTLNRHTAKVLADKIFDILVGRNARHARSIDLYDLEKFMPESMAQEALKAIKRSSTISRADLHRWLVTSFRKLSKLESNLSNNHAVMKNYNVILSCVVLFITTTWCLHIMNSLATKEFFTVWIEGDWMIVQEVKLLHSKFISENNQTIELENTYLLQQQIHVARDEDVWRQNDDDIVASRS